MNLNGSRNFGLLSWVSSIESGISGFEEENPPSDPPKSVFGGRDPSPIILASGQPIFGSARAVWAGELVPEFPWTHLPKTNQKH